MYLESGLLLLVLLLPQPLYFHERFQPCNELVSSISVGSMGSPFMYELALRSKGGRLLSVDVIFNPKSEMSSCLCVKSIGFDFFRAFFFYRNHCLMPESNTGISHFLAYIALTCSSELLLVPYMLSRLSLFHLSPS